MTMEERHIRQATAADLDAIEETYRAHFAHEWAHGAYTVFREGVYPTRQDAEAALRAGALWLCEAGGEVLGSAILDRVQPEEYRTVDWSNGAAEDRVAVLHLLLVRPSAAGTGVGSMLVRCGEALGRQWGCTVLRLDTGRQNLPAVALYRRLGFQVAASAPMRVGGAIPHGEHLFFEKQL